MPSNLSDDAVDGIAAVVLIALVVSIVVYWLETM
ncbi:MAG TPA: methionine synthase [Gammaproteobacteria bacterium]|nr:methionine synthase [Gammaproteobacteria bacterium]